MRLVEAEALLRGLGPVAKAVPDLALRVAVAAEKQRLRRLARDQHQRGLGLEKSGEVIEVAVEAIRVVAVAVAQPLRRGGDDGDAFAHEGGEAVAPRRVERKMVSGFHFRASLSSGQLRLQLGEALGRADVLP